MTMAAESDEVRRLIARASEEAAAMGNKYVGATHLLLALLSDGSSPAAELLERRGVPPATLRERCLAQLERHESIDPHTVTDLTARARASIRQADSEAARHNMHATRGIDVLVGLVAQHDSVASQVLHDAGLNYDELHREVYPPD